MIVLVLKYYSIGIYSIPYYKSELTQQNSQIQQAVYPIISNNINSNSNIENIQTAQQVESESFMNSPSSIGIQKVTYLEDNKNGEQDIEEIQSTLQKLLTMNSY